MSKRHFNDLAARLYRLKPALFHNPEREAMWRKMVVEMADFCASHSTTFKRDQFLSSCGINPHTAKQE